MDKNTDLLNRAPHFRPVSVEEQMLVEGGLSWSGIWGAIKDAATWVKDNVFVEPSKWVFGLKGTW
jgi:hypothetical protein